MKGCRYSECEYFYPDCGDREGVHAYCHYDSIEDEGVIPPCDREQKTVMAIVNRYGEIMCELERNGDFFWGIPKDRVYDFKYLCEGDEFRVEAIEVED